MSQAPDVLAISGSGAATGRPAYDGGGADHRFRPLRVPSIEGNRRRPAQRAGRRRAHLNANGPFLTATATTQRSNSLIDAPKPRIVAHRGATKRAAENTLEAFRTAIALGADAVEFDVQQTLDGDLVVIHDFELARTTNGEGIIRDTSTAHIRSLDASSWAEHAASAQGVPLLHEALDLEAAGLEIELKGVSASFVSAVLETVDRFDARSRVEFTSPFVGSLVQVRRHAPDATIGIFCRRPAKDTAMSAYRRYAVEDCVAIGADVLHLPVDLVDEEWVTASRQHGLLVHAANVDRAPDLRRVIALGVDQLSTNDCELAVLVRHEENRRG